MRRAPGPRTVVAWLAVLPWAVWAAVRLLGVERGYPRVQLMAYTPYVVLAVLLVPRVTGDAAEARAGGPQLHVLTANAYRGSVPPEALVDLVRRERVDVLAVQELTPSLAEGLEGAGLRELLPHGVANPGPRGGSGLYVRLPLRPLPPFEGAKSAMAAAALDVPRAEPVRAISVHVAVPLDGGDLAGGRVAGFVPTWQGHRAPPVTIDDVLAAER